MNYRKIILWVGAVVAVMIVAVLFIFNPAAHIAAHPGMGGASLAIAAVAAPEAEFQAKVLSGVEALREENKTLKSSYQKVLDDLDRSDKEVKKALEELTSVKNTCNDFAVTMKAMEKTQRAVALNARSSFRDPVARALENEETRAWWNCAARALSCTSEGDYKKIPAEMRKTFEEMNTRNKAFTGVDGGLGQATVPQETFNEIYDTLLDYGQWSTLGVMRVGMRTVVVPVASARPQYYWIGSGAGGQGEGSTITAGSFTGSSVTGIIQTLAAYLTVARELLADSTVDLAPYIMREMSQSISYGMDSTAFQSTGGADQTNAGYYGLFNAAQVNVNCAATTAQGNTTVAATQLDDWENVLNTVNPAVLNRSAKWWMHPQIVSQTILVRDKQGRPLFQTWLERPEPGAIMNILGYPVVRTGAAPNPATNAQAGQSVAAFGDPDGYAVLIRSDLELATSDDIGFPQNLRAFRALMRAGFKLKSTTASTTLIPVATLTLSPN